MPPIASAGVISPVTTSTTAEVLVHHHAPTPFDGAAAEGKHQAEHPAARPALWGSSLDDINTALKVS